MVNVGSNHRAEEHRRLSAGARHPQALVTAQAVTTSKDEQAGDARRGYLRPYAYVAAGLSFVAAQIHGWVMLDHFADQTAAGLFFLLVAFGQGAYAAALLDRPRSALLLVAGLGATVGLMLLLVVEHTVGLPFAGLEDFGHNHAEAFGSTGFATLAEAFDSAALATLVVEFGLVLALAVLLRGSLSAAKRAL